MEQTNKQNVNTLTLEGDTFNALKADFNMVLRKTLANMQHKGAEAAELKITVKITLSPENALDHGTDDDREITVPRFDHKVSSVMQLKSEKSGSVGGIGWELMWDKVAGQYLLVKVKDAQLSFFDDETTADDTCMRYLPAPDTEIIDIEITNVSEDYLDEERAEDD